MAQQSARRDRDNQAATPYFEYATLIWTRSANSHAGRRSMAAQEAGQMAASDYASRHPDVFPCLEGGVHRCCTDWPVGVGELGGRTSAPSLTLEPLPCRSKSR